MSGVRYFRDRMDTDNRYVLFPQEDPDNPQWCSKSKRFYEWGQKLVAWVEENPTPETIAAAKAWLQERYWQAYHSVEAEHRRDEAHADHPCLHQAFRDLREQLEDTIFAAPVS